MHLEWINLPRLHVHSLSRGTGTRPAARRAVRFPALSLVAFLTLLSAPLPAQQITTYSGSSLSGDKLVSAASADRSQSDSYVLRDNDLVRITVFQEDDMTTEVRISKSGYITFPLLGPVELRGKSVGEATAEIRTRLDKDYIINPQVTLTVMEYAQQWVTVLGEVQKPGQVQMPPEGGLDLLGAIALAGGYTRVADPGNVIVRRVVSGHDVVLRVNAKRLARDTSVQQFLVQPGDRISVSESIW
jgi:polysaccharide export outer membrane protein